MGKYIGDDKVKKSLIQFIILSCAQENQMNKLMFNQIHENIENLLKEDFVISSLPEKLKGHFVHPFRFTNSLFKIIERNKTITE
jgi:Txe/YoeB family toxin of Txe-Axe toxin-antitoxin module